MSQLISSFISLLQSLFPALLLLILLGCIFFLSAFLPRLIAAVLFICILAVKTLRPEYLSGEFYASYITTNYPNYSSYIVIFACLVLAAIVYFIREKTNLFNSLFNNLVAFLLRRTTAKRPKRSQQNELGAGDLASKDALKDWLTDDKDPLNTYLSLDKIITSEGQQTGRQKLVLPNEERNRHILTVAKTGSGKTSKLILPVLYNDCLSRERSTIVIDSKPEMWRKLAGLTKKYNPEKEIILFNPLDTARSLSWNILSKIESDTDAKLIANTIVMATDNPNSKGDTPFFRNNALSLLNSIMVGLLSDPNESLSMPRIHQLVQSGISGLCDWINAHPKALRTAKTFVELAKSGSQNADTVMSELAMRLSAWDLEAIRSTTAHSEIDLDKIINKPTLFILEFRESELEMLRPLANVIVIELLRYLTKRAESYPKSRLPRPVSLVIDEFASALGRLPDIHVKLNTLRSRNVSIVAAIQSIAQVKSNYGTDADSVLAGFGTKIFMPALDIQDADWAAKETGQMTIRYATASKGKNKKIIEWFASNNTSTQEQLQSRPVLTAEEIARAEDDAQTFFLPNTAPFQGLLVPFYQDKEMAERIDESDNSLANGIIIRQAPIQYQEAEPAVIQEAKQEIKQDAGKPNDTSDILAVNTPQDIRQFVKFTEGSYSAKQWWEGLEMAANTAYLSQLAKSAVDRNLSLDDLMLEDISR